MTSYIPVDGRHVPFSLHLGDRTPITLSKKNNKNPDKEEENIGTKVPETLYKAVKSLMEANQGASIKLAGMGNLKRQTQAAGKHGYEVEFPKGHVKHVPMAFELKAGAGAGKKVMAGNFFVPLTGPKGLVGPLDHCWKCCFKPVHAKVTPQKPFVMTSKALHLVKDEPMLLGCPAKPATEEAA